MRGLKDEIIRNGDGDGRAGEVEGLAVVAVFEEVGEGQWILEWWVEVVVL